MRLPNFNLRLLCVFLVFVNQNLLAQTCTDDYFTMTYEAHSDFEISQSLLTANGELICAGRIRSTPGSATSSDCWIGRMSQNGSVLWSKKVKIPGFNSAVLYDIVQGSDDSYYAVGEAGNVGGVSTNNNVKGIVLHLDKYGNLLQSLGLQISWPQEDQTIFKSIKRTREGDFAIGGYNNSETFSSGITNVKGVLLLMDKSGFVKWITTYSSPRYVLQYFYKSIIIETNDGSLVTALNAQEYISGNSSIPLSAFYIISVNKVTGARQWDVVYPNVLNTALVSNSYVSQISEMPGGNLSFASSFSEASYGGGNYNAKGVTLVTNSTGNLVNAQSYYNKRPGMAIAAGIGLNEKGDRMLFMDDAADNLLVTIDKDGKVLSQKAFAGLMSSPSGISLNRSREGANYLFMNDRILRNVIYLYKTDTNGSIECVNTEANLIAEDAGSFFHASPGEMNVLNSPKVDFGMAALPAIISDFVISSTSLCRKRCCTETVDTVNLVNICEAKSYKLPNNEIVAFSNTYYISYKAVTGCDSIVFYPVIFSQKPTLNLGPDTCLQEGHTLTLKADTGYGTYNWMNTYSNNNFFNVQLPGSYWVQATNVCGTATDSILISEKCSSEFFMPDAFTPNSDGLNDDFGITKYNTNRLIRFSIYNVFGKKIFETTDSKKRWNGTYKQIPQPAGVYVYHLQMVTLAGNNVETKGTLNLIR